MVERWKPQLAFHVRVVSGSIRVQSLSNNPIGNHQLGFDSHQSADPISVSISAGGWIVGHARAYRGIVRRSRHVLIDRNWEPFATWLSG